MSYNTWFPNFSWRHGSISFCFEQRHFLQATCGFPLLAQKSTLVVWELKIVCFIKRLSLHDIVCMQLSFTLIFFGSAKNCRGHIFHGHNTSFSPCTFGFSSLQNFLIHIALSLNPFRALSLWMVFLIVYFPANSKFPPFALYVCISLPTSLVSYSSWTQFFRLQMSVFWPYCCFSTLLVACCLFSSTFSTAIHLLQN